VTFDAFHYINLVTDMNSSLPIPINRGHTSDYLHENRLYVFDATVAKGMPPR